MDVNSGTAEKKKDESRPLYISLDSVQDYEFRVRFDQTQLEDLIMDEPSPLGHDKGPGPARLLAAAVAGCLSASFLFCAKKLRLNIEGLHADAKITHTRNEKGRLRIGNIDVEIVPHLQAPDEQKLQRCLDLYEDFCVVTQSVRRGLDVSVKVRT
jgi:uncharacterized OsmC-like protein